MSLLASKYLTSAVLLTLIALLAGSCTLAPMLCLLNLADVKKEYRFDFSKEELKDRIIGLYTYDVSLLRKNLGKTVIENTEVNRQYRQSVDLWLDKSNWNRFASTIRATTADTLGLIIGKHQSREQIQMQVIIRGDAKQSALIIEGIKYQRRKACEVEENHYVVELTERIEKKFINQLKN